MSVQPDFELPAPRDIDGIGGKLRHARLAKRLLLLDAAREMGCSESMLSKIECGKAIPSLGMLHRVAMALKTSIAELFNAAEERDFVLYRAGARPLVMIGPHPPEARIRLERLVPFSPGRSLEGNIHAVMPGAMLGGAIKNAGEEVGYVVLGQLELTAGERVSHLEEGDSFFFRSDLPHSYRNLGSVPGVVVWINTPPTF